MNKMKAILKVTTIALAFFLPTALFAQDTKLEKKTNSEFKAQPVNSTTINAPQKADQANPILMKRAKAKSATGSTKAESATTTQTSKMSTSQPTEGTVKKKSLRDSKVMSVREVKKAPSAAKK